MTASTIDLLTALGAHLAEFELPEIASARVEASPPGPPVTVQLPHHGPAALAQGLLAWADTLTQITTEVWRVPAGDSVHLSVTGRLPGGGEVQVYGGMPFTRRSPGADLTPGDSTALPLATLYHLATPGQLTEETAL
ncbi:MAG TPA: hypothetical protein VFO16_18440 [Pseudonocardiaceae bacterium]|nr:hypothetical protein [Pseudonocardiaceae bacterium]